MISCLFVAISMIISIILITTPGNSLRRIFKNYFVLIVFSLDLLYILANVILLSFSKQLIPTVKFGATIALVVITVLVPVLALKIKDFPVIPLGVFVIFFVVIGAVLFPVNHGVKEFDGEKYIGITNFSDSFQDWKYIYYYKHDSPLIISAEYNIVEDYGIILTSDWNDVKENKPYQIERYENGECVETEYCRLK